MAWTGLAGYRPAVTLCELGEKPGSGEEQVEVNRSASALFSETEDLVGAVLGHLYAVGIRADREDLIAFGRQGLLEAAERFDPKLGQDFRRFAYYRVRGAMIDGLRKMGHWSRRGYERVQMLRAAQTSLEWTEPVEVERAVSRLTPEQAAERLRKHMANMVTAMALGVLVDSEAQGSDSASAQGLNQEERLEERQLVQQLHLAVQELPEVERRVVERHYIEGERLDHVALDLGLSKSWISRIHGRALRRLGARMRAWR